MLLRWLPPALLALAALAGRAGAYGTPTFPCPDELASRVQFWVRTFTEFSGSQRIIHDARYPWVVYEILPVGHLNQRQINSLMEARKKHYTQILDNLACKLPEQYTAEEIRVAGLFSGVPDLARFTRARERIHSQPGVMEQFRIGLMRSGRYIESIQQVFDSLRVPREVGYLPHVESSFCPSVRSKAGALGLWQFTARTGRRFMHLGRDLDERLDPIVSTAAAGRYLREAFNVLGSWPLAIISYNHGVGGIARARAQLGSSDVVKVLQEYDGPEFGFASQNFYCEFLAAVEVAQNPEKYFGKIQYDLPSLTQDFTLPDHVRIGGLLKTFGVTTHDIAELNPALGGSYLQGSRPLPMGYVLHLPLTCGSNLTARFAAVPTRDRTASDPPPPGYKVRPGDTLAEIARRNRVPLETLRQMNDLHENDHIRPGQTLILPDAAHPRL